MKRIVLWLLCMAGLTGCLTTENEIKIVMQLSKSSLEFDYNGGEQNITVTSNTKEWSVSSSAPSWLKVSQGSNSKNGEITVTADPNTATTPRQATITIRGLGIDTKTIDVTIADAPENLSVSTTTLNFPASGQQHSFAITSNLDWSIQIDTIYYVGGDNSFEWLKVSPVTSSNDGSISVTASANPFVNPRTQTITVNSHADVTPKSIQVTQEGINESPKLTASPKTLEFSASGSETKYITVSSNIRWTANISNGSEWLSLKDAYRGYFPYWGSLDESLSVTLQPNTGKTTRTETITISGEGVPTQSIQVTQEVSLFMDVSTSSINISSNAGNTTFSINSNTSWSISGNPSWLTVTPASGSSDGTVRLSATANTSTSQRKATITVTGTGVTQQTIAVTQDGTSESLRLTVSPDKLDFAASGTETKYIAVSSNTSWTARISDGSRWIRINGNTTYSGSLNESLPVRLDPNTATTARMTTIAISGEGVPTRLIEVNQAPTFYMTSSTTSISFSPRPVNATTFTISSNTNWTISNNASWLTVTPASNTSNGMTTTTVTASATTNMTVSQRTATLSITGEGVTQRTIAVTQQFSSNLQLWDLSSTMKAALMDDVLVIGTSRSSEDMPNNSSVPLYYPVRSNFLSVVVENGVTAIGSYAFTSCNSFTTITMPEAIRRIGENAFNRCNKLEAIEIPKAVTAIGNYAFIYCTGLKTVTVAWDNPLTVPENIFNSTPVSTITLRVPRGTRARYQAANVWKNFGAIVEY